MSMLATIDSLPRIVISKADEKRLTAIATAASQRVPEASAALLSELERADVLPETAMPTDVVRIGSIIEFEVDDGRCLKEWSGHDDKERLLTVVAVSRPQSDRGEPLGSGNLFAPTSI
jgi:hypothetical protein